VTIRTPIPRRLSRAYHAYSRALDAREAAAPVPGLAHSLEHEARAVAALVEAEVRVQEVAAEHPPAMLQALALQDSLRRLDRERRRLQGELRAVHRAVARIRNTETSRAYWLALADTAATPEERDRALARAPAPPPAAPDGRAIEATLAEIDERIATLRDRLRELSASDMLNRHT
jgi:hypothetical protein